jgi:tetratricopeptide (TPR) repeat protein
MVRWMRGRIIVIPLLLCLGYFTGCITPEVQQKIKPQDVEPTNIALDEEYLNRGLAYYKEGKLDQAIVLFGECLKLNPDNQKARRLFEEALKKKGGEEKGAKKVKFEKIQQQPVEVEEEIQQEIFISPEEKAEEILKIKTDALNELIAQKQTVIKDIEKELLQQHKEELQEEELPKISKEDVQKEIRGPVPDFNFAKEMYSKGLFEAAAAELESILMKYPDTVLKEKVLYLLTDTLIKSKKYDKAIDVAQRLIDIDGEFKNDGIFMLAKGYECTGKLDEAQTNYLKAAKYKKPKYNKKKIDKKIQNFLDAIEPYPTPKDKLIPMAHLAAGEVYKQDKEYERSLFEYQQVIANYPDTEFAADAYFRIGEIYYKVYQVRDFQKAYEAYQKVVTQYPDSKWAKKAKMRAEYLWENYLR